ncbi:hypothetical protein Z949_2148 [Sulfitobacter guttiformis KCTC 32187]|nr:hypothetical protein Z949_2148 [Sulfitobacter guttiformis KCTC 32187]
MDDIKKAIRTGHAPDIDLSVASDKIKKMAAFITFHARIRRLSFLQCGTFDIHNSNIPSSLAGQIFLIGEKIC